MSKQLTISAVFSIIAMASFVLFSLTTELGHETAGAPIEIEAPAKLPQFATMRQNAG